MIYFTFNDFCLWFKCSWSQRSLSGQMYDMIWIVNIYFDIYSVTDFFFNVRILVNFIQLELNNFRIKVNVLPVAVGEDIFENEITMWIYVRDLYETWLDLLVKFFMWIILTSITVSIHIYIFCSNWNLHIC